MNIVLILLSVCFFSALKTGNAPWWHAKEKIIVANPVKKSRLELKD